jgi:polyisoprenoid-binding protein YceI
VKNIFFSAILVFSIFSPANAGQNDHLSIQPSSVLTLKGTSTLHDFECKTTSLDGTVEFDSVSGHFAAVDLKIPVKNIHSESSSMDDNMYEALKADENPDIKFTFLHYDTTAGIKASDKDSTFRIIGKLTVAGKEKTTDLDIVVVEKGNGIYEVTGEKKLLMTDYGVKPPTFMLGILKTGDEVTVEFNIELKFAVPSSQVSAAN